MAINAPSASICVLGAGAAGLITAHTLLCDGFDVSVLTRDPSPGGVWAKDRVYSGLTINNVHGEFRFSPMPMPKPNNARNTGGRLTGEDMCLYMESFAEKFLKGNITFGVEIENISRDIGGKVWLVKTRNLKDGSVVERQYDKIVLCTGGCSEPLIPESLSPIAAQRAEFSGPVFHSSQFANRIQDITADASPLTHRSEYRVTVVGGGKSAQDIAASLTNQGYKVTIIFDTADAILAVPIPLPDVIRKSRFLGILSPHITLKTRLERFLHTTWLGALITHGIWAFITWSSLFSFSIPQGSPFRRAHSLFWGIRTNDEGVMTPGGFFDLLKKGKVNVEAPERVEGFAESGAGLKLESGKVVRTDAVVLATGYKSSWENLFDEKTRSDLGLTLEEITAESQREFDDEWDGYVSLRDPPRVKNEGFATVASSVYRGMVPAKNLLNRDFAINGAIFSTNNGYVFEVCSHWISSYFLGDDFLRLPPSAERALYETHRNAAWLRKRYPGMLAWANESYSSGVAFWSWPQLVDEMLGDMSLSNLRSGGNWISWPFSVIDLKEIENLHEERSLKRAGRGIGLD